MKLPAPLSDIIDAALCAARPGELATVAVDGAELVLVRRPGGVPSTLLDASELAGHDVAEAARLGAAWLAERADERAAAMAALAAVRAA